jgi:hypothetical protein
MPPIDGNKLHSSLECLPIRPSASSVPRSDYHGSVSILAGRHTG